jgi:hypothetical protein
VFPHISGGKIWLPFTVETQEGIRACGMYELLPDDPKYQETKQCLEALRGEWSWSFFPEEEELAEIDRLAKADILDAWKLSPPPVITRAEWVAFCMRLFRPLHPLRLETPTGLLTRLATSTPQSREQSLRALKESLSEFDGLGLDKLRCVAFIKAHGRLLFGHQSPEEGAWEEIFDVLDGERQRQKDEWDDFYKRSKEEEARQCSEFRDYLESL